MLNFIDTLSNLNNSRDKYKAFNSYLTQQFNHGFNVDIKEDDESYILHADLPGLKKEDINVDFSQSGILTISVKNEQSNQQQNEKFILVERAFVQKQRKFDFGVKVDASLIKAKYDNGVLSLTLPKLEKKQTSTILID